jgi:hypothetical protein
MKHKKKQKIRKKNKKLRSKAPIKHKQKANAPKLLAKYVEEEANTLLRPITTFPSAKQCSVACSFQEPMAPRGGGGVQRSA